MKPALPLLLAATSSLALAQGTAADYERSRGLRTKFQDLAIDLPGPANWIGGTAAPSGIARPSRAARSSSWWMRRSRRSGRPSTMRNWPPRSAPSTKRYTLPFQEFTFVDERDGHHFHGRRIDLALPAGRLRLQEDGRRSAGRRSRRRTRPGAPSELDYPAEPVNDVVDGMVLEYPQQAQGGRPAGNSFQAFARAAGGGGAPLAGRAVGSLHHELQRVPAQEGRDARASR